jgi:hypothetical protein
VVPEITPPQPAEAPAKARVKRPQRDRRTAVGMRLASIPEAPPSAAPVEAPQPTVETPLRQVQFSAPGGTRVIWMLSTESVLD